MKLLDKWVMEAIEELTSPFTVDEVRDKIIAKKGLSKIIGSNTQIASYCKRYAYRVNTATYRRK